MIGIGCVGLAGHQIHARASSLARAELVAMAEADRHRVEAALGTPPSDAMVWHGDVASLLADGRVDLVSFCNARRDTQAADTIAALEAGKHVLAEKPMATTLEDLAVLRRAHAASGRRCWTMLPMVYDPAFLGLKQVVQSGAIGQIVQVYALKSYPFHESRPQDRGVDGGLIMQAGIHAISLIGHVTGRRFEQVFAHETGRGNPFDGDLQMGATISGRLTDGTLATVLCNYCKPAGLAYHGNDQIRVHGTRGMVELVDGFTRRCVVEDAAPAAAFPDVAPARSYPQDMIDALLDGTTTLLSEEDGFHFTEVVLQAQASATAGRPLPVD